MTYQKSNLIHATVLTLTSLWMYYDALNKDFGLLIPFLFGVVLLSLNNGIMYDNVSQRNAAMGITVLSLLFITYMIVSFVQNDDMELIGYFGLMSFTSLWSIAMFIWTLKSKTLKH